MFRNIDGREFVEYVCLECRIMRGLEFLEIEQSESIISKKRCHHSKACHRKMNEDVNDYFDIPDLPDNIEVRTIFTHEDIEEVTLRNDRVSESVGI